MMLTAWQTNLIGYSLDNLEIYIFISNQENPASENGIPKSLNVVFGGLRLRLHSKHFEFCKFYILLLFPQYY